MEKRFFLKSCSGDFKIRMPQDYKINILKSELSQHKSIKVPYVNHSISGDELADWLLEVSSPREVDEIVLMIQCARKRGSRIKSLLQTIAAALVK